MVDWEEFFMLGALLKTDRRERRWAVAPRPRIVAATSLTCDDDPDLPSTESVLRALGVKLTEDGRSQADSIVRLFVFRKRQKIMAALKGVRKAQPGYLPERLRLPGRIVGWHIAQLIEADFIAWNQRNNELLEVTDFGDMVFMKVLAGVPHRPSDDSQTAAVAAWVLAGMEVVFGSE